MNITERKIKVRDLIEGYVDNDEEGVRGYGGRLDIRPAYQREFVYGDKERNAVIDTVMKRYPLNVMYWAVKKDGTFELMDGQQRTISLCRYAAGDFAWGELEINARYFAKQPSDIKERFLDYELTIYVCEGSESEKLDWFQVINIAGLKLTNQEMRNAVYSGPWVTDAKRYFSRRTAPAARLGGKYLSGDMDRQAYLERAICWLIGSEKDIAIRQYMALHQGDEEAVELWLHFQKVIGWVETMFPKYRKEMKGLNWGALYARYSDRTYNPRTLDGEVAKLMADREVESKRGIYEFLLSGRRDFHLLNLRQFDEEDKRTVYEQQKGVCPCCLESFSFEEMEGDHIKPWSKGGKTRIENLQMLCRECNARKSDKF